MPEITPPLDLFVYGTLKAGHVNHARYCRSVVSITPASVIGRLYLLPAGYPQLVIPEAEILQTAGVNSAVDQQQLVATPPPEPVGAIELPWRRIEGEIIRMADASALAGLDRLEDFVPGRTWNHYLRVVTRTADVPARWVWTYIAPGGGATAAIRELGERWP